MGLTRLDGMGGSIFEAHGNGNGFPLSLSTICGASLRSRWCGTGNTTTVFAAEAPAVVTGLPPCPIPYLTGLPWYLTGPPHVSDRPFLPGLLPPEPLIRGQHGALAPIANKENGGGTNTIQRSRDA